MPWLTRTYKRRLRRYKAARNGPTEVPSEPRVNEEEPYLDPARSRYSAMGTSFMVIFPLLLAILALVGLALFHLTDYHDQGMMLLMAGAWGLLFMLFPLVLVLLDKSTLPIRRIGRIGIAALVLALVAGCWTTYLLTWRTSYAVDMAPWLQSAKPKPEQPKPHASTPRPPSTEQSRLLEAYGSIQQRLDEQAMQDSLGHSQPSLADTARHQGIRHSIR